MKIEIKNLLKTSRLFGSPRHENIIKAALEVDVISKYDLQYLEAEYHSLFKNIRVSDYLITRVTNLNDILDKFAPDFTIISNRIAIKLAKKFNIANFRDIALTTINKIQDDKIYCQFSIPGKNWQGLEVTF